MTLVLLTSSLTMLGAVAAAQRGPAGRDGAMDGRHRRPRARLRRAAPPRMVQDVRGRLEPLDQPVGGPVLFGASFFSITGLHMLHVIGGVVALTVVAACSGGGGSPRDTSRPPGSTGTSSTWCGCSSSRSFT